MNQKEHILNGGLLAIGLGYILKPSGSLATFQMVGMLFIPIILGCLFPDIDAHYGRHRKALHNLPVLGLIAFYPLYLDNLHFVWIGIISHFVLDIVGSKRGIALFYPIWDREFSLPAGVTVSSEYTVIVTVIITVIEVGIGQVMLWILHKYQIEEQLMVIFS
ncbi:MAG: metal-dependent hydrolase [Halobacteriaceae archaeon]